MYVVCHLTEHNRFRASVQFLVCPRGLFAVPRQLWGSWGAHSPPEHPLFNRGWGAEQGAEVELEHSEWILGISFSLSIGLEQVALGACPASVLGAFWEHLG